MRLPSEDLDSKNNNTHQQTVPQTTREEERTSSLGEDGFVVMAPNSNHPLSLISNSNFPAPTNNNNSSNNNNPKFTTTKVEDSSETSCTNQNDPTTTTAATLPISSTPDADDEEDCSDLQEDPTFTETSFFSPCHFPSGQTFLSVSLHMRKQAISASGAQAVDMLARVVALSAIGRTHSTNDLASCGIGISAFNVISLSIAVGWSSAIDTLASTAFGRLQKKAARIEEVGEITQLGLGLGLAISIFTGIIILLFANPIVKNVFGPQYVDGATEFLYHAMPFLISFTTATSIFKSLQAQHLAEIPSKACFVGFLVTIVCSFTIIPWFGIKGVAWTLFFSNIVQILVCLKLAARDDVLLHKVPWFPPTRWKKIFTQERIKEYVTIAIPSMLACSSEWLAFEFLNVLVARIGERETAAFGIFFSVGVFCWSLSAGIATACYSHVGKLLGEGKPMMAKVFARTSIIWAWMIAICSCTLVTIFHNFIFGLYTKDPELMKELSGVLVLFWMYHQSDNTQYTIQACFRGAGKQDEAVKPVLCSLWLIGLPCAYLFSHHIDTSLHSLLLGFNMGFVFEIPLLMRKVLQWDWKVLAEEAAKRRHEEEDDIVAHQHELELEEEQEGQVEQQQQQHQGKISEEEVDERNELNIVETACV